MYICIFLDDLPKHVKTFQKKAVDHVNPTGVLLPTFMMTIPSQFSICIFIYRIHVYVYIYIYYIYYIYTPTPHRFSFTNTTIATLFPSHFSLPHFLSLSHEISLKLSPICVVTGYKKNKKKQKKSFRAKVWRSNTTSLLEPTFCTFWLSFYLW